MITEQENSLRILATVSVVALEDSFDNGFNQTELLHWLGFLELVVAGKGTWLFSVIGCIADYGWNMWALHTLRRTWLTDGNSNEKIIFAEKFAKNRNIQKKLPKNILAALKDPIIDSTVLHVGLVYKVLHGLNFHRATKSNSTSSNISGDVLGNDAVFLFQ